MGKKNLPLVSCVCAQAEVQPRRRMFLSQQPWFTKKEKTLLVSFSKMVRSVSFLSVTEKITAKVQRPWSKGLSTPLESHSRKAFLLRFCFKAQSCHTNVATNKGGHSHSVNLPWPWEDKLVQPVCRDNDLQPPSRSGSGSSSWKYRPSAIGLVLFHCLLCLVPRVVHSQHALWFCLSQAKPMSFSHFSCSTSYTRDSHCFNARKVAPERERRRW